MTVELRSAAFRRVREAEWRELERLVGRIESGGLSRLSPAEIARLPLLHRAALSSVSVARAVSLDRNALEYLEALAGRSHAAIYGARRGRRAFVVAFWRELFPRAVRGAARPLAASAASLVLGAIAGYVLTAADEGNYYAFMPASLAAGRGPGTTTEVLREGLFSGEGSGSFAAMLFTHNSQVAILCFVAGLAGGLPGLLLLFQNGLLLGAFAALYAGRGLAFELWGWILPHGGTEMFALLLGGAAGVSIGTAILFPGERTRRAAMAAAGGPAGLLVMGASGLLALAGIIEGVFRQEVDDTGVRYVVAVSLAFLWTIYFLFAGRSGAAGIGADA